MTSDSDLKMRIKTDSSSDAQEWLDQIEAARCVLIRVIDGNGKVDSSARHLAVGRINSAIRSMALDIEALGQL